MLSTGRRLLLLLAAAFLATPVLRASDLIPDEPTTGRSATVIQPHVTAELISETTSIQIGKPFDVILHLHMDPDWHTYWINPGDAGLATTIKWTLPPGIQSAGPIRWPTPEVHAMGPLTTYGYGGDVYLLTTLTPIPALAGYLPHQLQLKARASWLVCQEECIPGRADFVLTLNCNIGEGGAASLATKAFFDAARARVPIPNTEWNVTASYRGGQLALSFVGKPGAAAAPLGTLSFFCEQPNVVGTKSNLLIDDNTDLAEIGVHAHLALVQNGEKPDHLSGVLVSDRPLLHGAKAVYFASFPVGSAPATGPDSTTTVPASSPSAPPAANSAVTPVSVKPASSAPFLPAILAAAFLGGLILNLMPCVLPVLSLKVFSLIKHAGDETGGAWRQGLAFAGGVVVSFWILAGILIALESAGQHLGWGFQMQSPGFVLALIFLFFLLGLNLFGVFELGTSLVGLDVKATSQLGGLASSFANGALATLAATPCTAPFMGSAVGFAAQQPAAISLLVFTALALGMAAPYLALTTFPGALRLVPKPGAWMETLKQFMGFLLMGTVIFLVYVFIALTRWESVAMILGVLLLAAMAAWIFGRAHSPVVGPVARISWTIVALALLALSIGEGISLSKERPSAGAGIGEERLIWDVWSPGLVQQALAQGRPVFVDFTAAWCLSCKVNERLALDIDSTRALFRQKHVRLFVADWTHSDPQISDTLRAFNRDGVPLYLVYSPKNPDAPQVLPEVLTPGIVRDALQKLP